MIDWVARDPRVYLASALADSGLCVEAKRRPTMPPPALAVGAITRHGLEQAASLRLALGAGVTAEERRALEDWSGRLAGGLEIDGGYTGAEFTPLVCRRSAALAGSDHHRATSQPAAQDAAR